MDKLDLRQLFQIPVKQILFPTNHTIQSSAMPNNEDCPLIYHAAKLRKHMGLRYDSNGDSLGLDMADGFETIEPDTEIPPSPLLDLLYEPGTPSKCELLLVVAMYNEGIEQFKNTLCGIANNLKAFVRYGVHPKKIGCCVIIDGMKPFLSTLTGHDNRGSRKFFSQFFDEERINCRFQVTDPNRCELPGQQDHDEFAHIFMQNVVLDDEGMLPLQLFFTIKQKNLRKLNTHLWFFGGFCEMIQPSFVMLVDVGTKPLENSLFYLYEAMKVQPKLAGCCGEIKPMNANLWKLVVPAQEVEYKFSHIFDKALESVLGYITVLPGAFSAYRWEALQGNPLWNDYFKSICHPEEMGPFNSNIYLAEDRVLCLSLVSKQGASYTLRYVRASVAETDVPETIAELMSQRRRWINGSWFALIDSLRNFQSIFRSDHTLCRKIVFSLQMAYYYFTVLFSWFMVGSFYMVFAVTMSNEYGDSYSDLGSYFVISYVALLFTVYTLALSVKPKRTNDLYKGIAVVFGLYMLLSFYLTSSYLLVSRDSGETDWARYTILAASGVFILNVLLNCCAVLVLRGLFHFLFMIPTYVNIFLIYAICNTHDISWGNRPDQMTAEESKRVEEFEEFRSRWTMVWALSNSAFGSAFVALNSSDSGNGWYLYVIALSGFGILLTRTLGGLFYLCQEKCSKEHLKKDKKNDLYRQLEKDKKDTSAMRVNESSVIPMTIFNNAKEPSPIPFKHENGKLSEHNLNYVSELQSSISGSSESATEHNESFSSNLTAQGASAIDLKHTIRFAREQLNMSLSFLAEEIGIPSEKLQQIEEGAIEPEEAEIQQLLAALNKF